MDTFDKDILSTLERDILPVLCKKISDVVRNVYKSDICGVEELRLRAEKPLMICKGGMDYFVSSSGKISDDYKSGVYINSSDIEKTLQLMSNYSIYSIEEELKQGFLTLKGGHRVGLTGREVMEGDNIKTLKNVSAMNIRIAREVRGCGTQLVEKLFLDGVKHTLIASPPGCGKTTILRDIVRILSWGDKNIGIKGHKIGIVDERSEIAGCYLGVAQRDVGIRTDVLDACPKAQGMKMLLRSMSPEIIAVDEIGSMRDAEAIEDAVNSGVKVIATVHGKDIDEIILKPGVRNLVRRKAFDRLVILSRKDGPGTIEKIINITQ